MSNCVCFLNYSAKWTHSICRNYSATVCFSDVLITNYHYYCFQLLAARTEEAWQTPGQVCQAFFSKENQLMTDSERTHEQTHLCKIQLEERRLI